MMIRDVKIVFFYKIDFFSIIFSRRHSDGWLLEHTGLLWGLMQPSMQVVERQAYSYRPGHPDWTDHLHTRLATRRLLSHNETMPPC